MFFFFALRDAPKAQGSALLVMSCYYCCSCCYEDEEEIGGTIGTRSYGRHGRGSSYGIGEGQKSGNGLGIASGISALLSLVIVSVAICTGQWLLTEEKLSKSYSVNASAEPDSKVTYSGLWRVCVATSESFASIAR